MTVITSLFLATSLLAGQTSFNENKAGLPRTAQHLRAAPAEAAHAVILSSGAIRQEDELRRGQDQSYLSLAMQALADRYPSLPQWRLFQMGYPGMDSLTAGLDNRSLLGRWPVLTLVELSEGDRLAKPEDVSVGLEGLIRNNGKREPRSWEKPKHLETDFMILHSPSQTLVQQYLDGEPPAAVAQHEAIARHYDVPTLNLAARFAAEVAAENVELATLYAEDGGLSPEGHALAGEMLAEALSAALEGADPLPGALPTALAPREELLSPARVAYERVDYGAGWLDWQESAVPRFFHVLRADGSAGSITVEMEGRLLAAQVLLEPGTGDLEVSVDDGPWQHREVFREERFGEPVAVRTVVLARDLDPEVKHTVRIRVADTVPEGSAGREMAIAWFFVDGEVVNVDPQAGMSPLEVADAIYATMPPIAYEAPADRWAHLPKTRARLTAGGDLRVVTLGDSIINDMRRSRFEHLMMRSWPGSTVRVFNSVRGSTGCWYYAKENRVEEYVTRYKPDLLVIGGISHRNDIDSIRQVIEQTRESLPEVEILLLTGPFGWVDPVGDSDWRKRDQVYNAALEQLATEEEVAFFDLQGAWADYLIHQAGALKPFKRDVVHANLRGSQMLGRLFNAYLSD